MLLGKLTVECTRITSDAAVSWKRLIWRQQCALGDLVVVEPAYLGTRSFNSPTSHSSTSSDFNPDSERTPLAVPMGLPWVRRAAEGHLDAFSARGFCYGCTAEAARAVFKAVLELGMYYGTWRTHHHKMMCVPSLEILSPHTTLDHDHVRDSGLGEFRLPHSPGA